jgi:hypothetical protein
MQEPIKLYCPPTGNPPEELPDYCRFFNGVIRRDLQSLSDEELHLWGWDGPFNRPNAKNVNRETGEVVENDYDPETQKVVWYSKERMYIILPKDEDSTEYEIPYRSGVILPSPVATPEAPPVPQQPIYQLPTPPPILWGVFKQSILESPEFNSFIGTVFASFPIIASSFPLAISKIESGNYDDFKLTWNSLVSVATVPDEIINNLKELSINCNLPQDFLNILGE